MSMAAPKQQGSPGQSEVISPPDLYTILLSSRPVVIFDCRNKEDFNSERIWSSIHLDLQNYKNLVGIARQLFITRNDPANPEHSPITPHTHKNLFVNRDIHHIVVVDENGSDSRGLITQLRHHKPTQLLVGGYKMFSMLYPQLCVGSSGQDLYAIEKCEKEWAKHSPVEVLPYLFFGDVHVAQNFRAIDILGIGSMVNVAAHVNNFAPAAYKYLRCDQEELPFGDLAPLFNKVFKFIENAKKENDKVLIYSAGNDDCRAGMFVCAYLMRLNGCPLEAAFAQFKRKAKNFSPNVPILSRLGEYEASLSGTKHLEEHLKQKEEGVKVKVSSEELNYVRRVQAHQLEEDRANAAEEEEEEGLC